MKTTLIVIQNDADHAQAQALIEKLMNSKDPANQAQMMAQAYLTEAYERSRWPRRAPSLPDLLSFGHRTDQLVMLAQPARGLASRQTPVAAARTPRSTRTSVR